jgi:hypothetical protein
MDKGTSLVNLYLDTFTAQTYIESKVQSPKYWSLHRRWEKQLDK